MKNWLAKGRFKSVLIFIIGFFTQIISWFVLFGLVANPESGFRNSGLDDIATFAWFALFAFSILGIAAGVAYLRNNGRSLIAILGVVLNVIWFCLFSFIVLIILSGVTA